MSRTSYWLLLLVSSVVAAGVWSGSERWEHLARQPHIAAVLEHFEVRRASAQAPPTTSAGYNPITVTPAYAPGYAPAQPVQPNVPIQSRVLIAPPQPQSQVIEGAQVIATIGELVVLAEEIIGPINQTLAQHKAKMTAQQFEQARRTLIQKAIKRIIPTKLLYGEYLVSVPPEGQTQVTKSLAERFAQEQLPELMKKAGVASRVDLDAKFRSLGTSLERQRQQFIESSISGQWMQQSVTYDREVTYDQMVDHYRKNLKEYEIKENVRWQQISIYFDKAQGEANAQAEVVRIGNMLWSGADFDAVAKKFSHGFKSEDGGKHDAITRGALASRTFEDALFALPVGKLSRIIRDDKGLHIAKVLKHVQDGVTPFTDAQGDIKKAIVKKRRKDAIDAYLSDLQDRTDIWTIFDDAPAREASQVFSGAYPGAPR